jgi:pimeloyl-ACP methyl ester carboxylesterase
MAHADINGARLWYQVRGTGAPILFHHGYTASRVNWEPVTHQLEAHYQVILMECRGTGESEHTLDGYTLEQYSADTIAMLDHLGLARASFAGHSMGGGVGYLLGLEHSDRLDKLILMAPIPAKGIGEITPEMRQQRIAERNAGDREGMLTRYRAMRFREDVETDSWFESRVDHLLAVSDGHFIQSAESMAALDVAAHLGDLTTPTLMIAGGVDSLLQANLEDYLSLPNATLEVLSRAGHEVAVHEPQRVAEAIDQFMQHGPITAQSLMAKVPAEISK